MKNPKRYENDVHGWLTFYNINKALETLNEKKSLKEMIFLEYYGFLTLVEKATADKLSVDRPHDHQIPLKEEFTPSSGLVCMLSQPKLKLLGQWI